MGLTEKRDKKLILELLIGLVLAFLAGMACEIVFKVIFVQNNISQAGAPDIYARKIMAMFGDESIPIYTIPGFILNWMRIVPETPVENLLRWIPYLLIFALPILSSVIKRRSIPLIICCAFAAYEGVGILIARMYSKYVYFTYQHAVPFLVEAFVLLLACIALWTKKKGFSIAMGAVCVVLAILSPFVTTVLSGLTPQTNMMPGFQLGSYLNLKLSNLTFYDSMWPIFKAFAFLMYALILFIAPSRFRKKTLV